MQKSKTINVSKPNIVLNFKVYIESGGLKGEELSLIADSVAKNYPQVNIIICPQTPQLAKISSIAKYAKVFGQSIDVNPVGKFTGSITAKSISDCGAKGTLLNHAEKQLPLSSLKLAIQLCEQNKLVSLVCANSVELAKTYSQFSPWSIAVEIPELIGSGISVSNANPKVVTDAVLEIEKINPKIIVMVGAGVSNYKDVKKCLELGAKGVLLASGFVLAKNPKELLEQMANACKEYCEK